MLPRAAAGTPRLRSPLHHVARDTSSNKRSASDERVDRPRAGAVDDQRDCRAKREEVVLHTLALWCTEPVHKEAVLFVNEDRHEHDGRDAERRHAREQTDRQPERAEKFGNHGKECKSRREAGLREGRHGAPETVPAEPSERLLRAVWEHDNGKGQPEDEWNNATIRRDEPVDHDDLHDTFASVMATSTSAAASDGDAATLAPRWDSATVRSRSRFHTRTSWPASSSRIAIGVPICPSPRNAILDISGPPFACRARRPSLVISHLTN